MNDQNDPLLLDHDADGIRELDNNLPRWWVWLFYITILYSIVYLGYYHVFATDKTSAAEYEIEKAAGDKIKAATMARFEGTMNALVPGTDTAALEQGRQTYQMLCAPCHRLDGGGLVGPNLCDDYWIHGSNFVDSVRVVWNGVPEKGMITWKTTLNPQQIHAVASYIYTMRGTNPQNPKPPENQTPAQTGPSEFE
ncbi:MAG TPA: cbb3-type cytochrome c oxidase N-terminal domain-containing protein [Verrucomicrobiota bacterium]|nr:cbb3-type cytochrome c oxidase N-terminal domain-containing protein [Verrucomicrobiota bacterium]